MKKIPTLFEREFANHRVVGISDKVTPGMEWVLAGEGMSSGRTANHSARSSAVTSGLNGR